MATSIYELQGAEDRRFSPYCWRIRMALAHKGITPEAIPVRFTEKPKIAFSGQTRVPVLVDNETTITDSWDIACYLEETYPAAPTLFPGGRALAHFVQGWANTILSGSIRDFIILDIWRHLDPEDQAYFRETREARMGRTLEEAAAGREDRLDAFRNGLQPLRDALSQAPYLCGDNPAYADYIVFGQFQWARCISDFSLLEADDTVFAWRQRLLDAFGGLAKNAVGYHC